MAILIQRANQSRLTVLCARAKWIVAGARRYVDSKLHIDEFGFFPQKLRWQAA
jgi:hypothetical protein